MAPMVVAANSRGGYPRRPAEQRVNNEFMLGPRAAVARIAHQVQNGCRRSNAHLAGQDPPRPWPTPMAPTDGLTETGANARVDVPPDRVCDRPSRRAAAADRASLARSGGSQSHLLSLPGGAQAAGRRAAATTERLASTCSLLRVQAGRAPAALIPRSERDPQLEAQSG